MLKVNFRALGWFLFEEKQIIQLSQGTVSGLDMGWGREAILSHLAQAVLPVLLSLCTSRPALFASIMPRSSGPKTPKAPKGLLQAIKAHSSKAEANQLQETITAIVKVVEQNPESANKF